MKYAIIDTSPPIGLTVPGGRMTVKEAWDKGLIVTGARIRCNGDGHTTISPGHSSGSYIEGVVGHISGSSFDVLSNTHEGMPNGTERYGFKYGWYVTLQNTQAFIEFLV